MLDRSIVGRLITYFLLLNIITVIVVGSYSYFRAKNALLERTYDQLTSIRTEKEYRLEKLFEDRTDDISLIAKSEDVLNIIGLLEKTESGVPILKEDIFSEYDKFLRRHFFSNRNYRRFFIASEQGISISFETSMSDSSLADLCLLPFCTYDMGWWPSGQLGCP